LINNCNFVIALLDGLEDQDLWACLKVPSED
jgi:hypothetical protein